MVPHVCNPAIQESAAEGQRFQSQLGPYIERQSQNLKKTNKQIKKPKTGSGGTGL